MSWLQHEWRHWVRSKLTVASLTLLMALSTLAVFCGLREVARQEQTITRLAGLQQQDLAAQAHQYDLKSDAGSAAYYTFHGTWDAPSTTAFLALGLRDVTPNALRVRALALQAQLHEGESFNPELALTGRFDFAFLLVYLAPLFLITLLYDLFSDERRSGRLTLLQALPRVEQSLWLRRAVLRSALVWIALVMPAITGAWISGATLAAMAGVILTTTAYVAIWSGLAMTVAMRRTSSAANAMALVACWALLTLVLPTLANVALGRAVPVHQGVELMLKQRQAVHAAWDEPPNKTMEKFFRTHPQWRDTAPLPTGFHWKWYYAFQQLGDESVALQVAAYRQALLKRQRWTDWLGWILPGVGVQAALHRQANTDLQAQLNHQDQIADFHERLRSYYYPYLFKDLPFTSQDFHRQPVFSPQARLTALPVFQWLGLTLLASLLMWAGVGAACRVREAHG